MRRLDVLSCALLATALSFGCSSSDPAPADTAGGASGNGAAAGAGGTPVTGGSAGTGATAGAGGTGGSTGGASGSAAAAGAGGSSGTASPDATAPADSSPGADSSAPETSVGIDAQADGANAQTGAYGGPTGTLLPCTAVVHGAFYWDANNKGVGNGVECDWPQVSVDFEDVARPYKTLAPTPWTITNWGKAFTKSEINGCHPYCFDRALVVGIDIVGDGTPEASQGEVLIDYPTPPAPVTYQATAGMMLAWFFVEGPAGAGLTVQLEARNQAGTVALYPVPARAINPGGWVEFKVNPLGPTFSAAALTNMIGVGVKVAANPPLAAGKEWHGKIHIDHIQVSDRLTGTAGP